MVCKLIIAGSRSIKRYEVVRNAVIESGLWGMYKKDIEVVCGMAKGVDLLGKEFAKKNGLTVHERPADWDNIKAPGAKLATRTFEGKTQKYNKLAGLWRNHSMGDESDEALIVWDGVSTGSFDMLEYMLQLGKPTYLYPTTRIGADLFDALTAKGCEIIVPNSLTDK